MGYNSLQQFRVKKVEYVLTIITEYLEDEPTYWLDKSKRLKLSTDYNIEIQYKDIARNRCNLTIVNASNNETFSLLVDRPYNEVQYLLKELATKIQDERLELAENRKRRIKVYEIQFKRNGYN